MSYSPRQNAQRGLAQFAEQPTTDELERLDSFSYCDGSIRVTFRKRQHGPEHGRGKRKPTWNGFATIDGRTVAAYAGNSETFNLDRALSKIRKASEAIR
jgi:hypothetical protein